MKRSEQITNRIGGMDLWVMLAAIAIAVLLLGAATPAQAQTFTVLHTFSGPDGALPYAGVTMDQAGNLYGTASRGGYTGGTCDEDEGCGTVFELKHESSGWILNSLYAFAGPDGEDPEARVIFGPDGSLYGTTCIGGAAGYGVVFRLRPPATVCKTALCPWTETVLYSFSGGSDGGYPAYGDLAFDQAGNIYGTTSGGGSDGEGTVFELSPSNGGWTESVLHSFQGNSDGAAPTAGVIFDDAGNIYGTTVVGGTDGGGTVYELTPSASGWTETILHSFIFGEAAGTRPFGGLIFDPSGNLYGTTSGYNPEGGGSVYELTPSNGGWNFNVLYSFNEDVSAAKLTMDAAGRLYGTSLVDSPEVFQLTLSDGQWTLTGFNGSAGEYPYGNVILDASGNVYSTTNVGGTHGDGVVFEVTP